MSTNTRCSEGPAKEVKPYADDMASAFPSVQLVYLFGSRAHGDHADGSDIDLAIWVDAARGGVPGMIGLEVADFLDSRAARCFDVVVLNEASPVLQHEAIARGVLLFERDPAVRARVELLAFKNFEDHRHMQRKMAILRARGYGGLPSGEVTYGQ